MCTQPDRLKCVEHMEGPVTCITMMLTSCRPKTFLKNGRRCLCAVYLPCAVTLNSETLVKQIWTVYSFVNPFIFWCFLWRAVWVTRSVVIQPEDASSRRSWSWSSHWCEGRARWVVKSCQLLFAIEWYYYIILNSFSLIFYDIVSCSFRKGCSSKSVAILECVCQTLADKVEMMPHSPSIQQWFAGALTNCWSWSKSNLLTNWSFAAVVWWALSELSTRRGRKVGLSQQAGHGADGCERSERLWKTFLILFGYSWYFLIECLVVVTGSCSLSKQPGLLRTQAPSCKWEHWDRFFQERTVVSLCSHVLFVYSIAMSWYSMIFWIHGMCFSCDFHTSL